MNLRLTVIAEAGAGQEVWSVVHTAAEAGNFDVRIVDLTDPRRDGLESVQAVGFLILASGGAAAAVVRAVFSGLSQVSRARRLLIRSPRGQVLSVDPYCLDDASVDRVARLLEDHGSLEIAPGEQE